MNEFEKQTVRAHGADSEPRASSEGRRTVDWNRAGTTSLKETSFPATIENVPRAIKFLKHSLEELGCPPKMQVKLAVIIDEIVSNIAKFAYGPSTGDVAIRISTERNGSVLELSFIDKGIAFNPLDAPRVDTEAAVASRKIGGQGILIVQRIADEVEYERKDGKNILRVRKYIERQPERSDSMEISKVREGNQLSIKLVGELNTATAPELEAALENDVNADDTIVFDMTDLSYMTSAGLRLLVACDAATGGRGAVILRGVCDEIREVLEVTGFDTILTIE